MWLRELETCWSSLSGMNWQGQACRGDGMAELAVMERGVGGLGMQGGQELGRQKTPNLSCHQDKIMNG